MKKISVVLLAAMFFFVSSGHAQGFHLGIKAGTNVTSISGNGIDKGLKLGYSVGAYAEINFTKEWGIQPEVFFNHLSSETKGDAGQDLPGTQIISGVPFNVSYISIPLLLTYRPIPLLSFQFGPMYGAKINESGIVESGKDAFKSGDFSLIGGAQLNITKLKIGARYVGGVTNVSNLSSNNTWKNNGFQVYVGLNLF